MVTVHLIGLKETIETGEIIQENKTTFRANTTDIIFK